MTRLEYLNLLRDKAGMPPLRSWKDSKAKLEVRIGEAIGLLSRRNLDIPVYDALESVVSCNRCGRTRPVTATTCACITDQSKNDAYPPPTVTGRLSHSQPEMQSLNEPKRKCPDVSMDFSAVEARAIAAIDLGADTFTLSEIAASLNINPKVARAIMRRKGGDITRTGAKWVFANNQRDAVTKLLGGK